MALLFTTSNLGLKGFVPGTAWLDFNDNLTVLDTYYAGYLYTTALDTTPGRTSIPLAPVARTDFMFDLIKKAQDEIVADSIYVNVLGDWLDNILDYESVPVPYTAQPSENDDFSTSDQMIGNGTTWGDLARKDGSKFKVKAPTVTSATGKTEGVDGHYELGPVAYSEADFILALTDAPDYVLAYEEMWGNFTDLDQAAASQDYNAYDQGESKPEDAEGIPGQRWDGLVGSGGTLGFSVDAYAYDFAANASGLKKFLGSSWSTGDQPDFFGELGTIRPPGYASYRTLGQDLYNAVLLYREAYQKHLETTLPDRLQAMADSASNDMVTKSDELEALQTRIDTDVSNELDRVATILEGRIFPELHLSNDYVIQSGIFSEYTMDDAIDMVNNKTDLHEDNYAFAEINLVDGAFATSGLVDVVDVAGTMTAYRGSTELGTLTIDSEGNSVVAGSYTAFPVGSERMFIKVPFPNPHDVHVAARYDGDQGVVTSLPITYVASEYGD